MNEFLSHFILVACIMFFAMSSLSTSAQDISLKPPLTPERFEHLKDKADRFYQAGRMEESFAIFNGILAQNGDQYSQYMTGYMLYLGQGTPADESLGSAWMMVAANAGNGLLFEAATAVFNSLDQGARRDAHKFQRDLNNQFGRCALKKRLILQLQNLARKPSRRRRPLDTTRVTAIYGLDALEAPRELSKARAKAHEEIVAKACL